MARYIDLDKVAEHKNSYCNTTSITHCNRDCAECFYSNGGAEDVVPVIHAKWIDVKVAEGEPPVVLCPICEMYFCDIINNHHYMYHYCPNCNAKMDGEPIYSYEEKIELYKQLETLEKLCGADNWERIENYWERLENREE